MGKDLTESRYVIVTEDEEVYSPFSSREEAQKRAEILRAEILRDPVTGNLPRITITNESKYVNIAESRVDEVASEIVNRIVKTAKREFGIDI